MNYKMSSVKIKMEHFQDIGKVAGANLAALAISCSNLEGFFRVAGLIVAFIYTCLKIWDLLRKWDK
jgi:hypothetical protein